jgi:predicted transcriptional regulator
VNRVEVNLVGNSLCNAHPGLTFRTNVRYRSTAIDEEVHIMDARDLMAPALNPLNESDTVVTAARRMRALGVSTVPVAGEGNGFVGMVRERDIVENCVAAALDPRQLAVGSIVSRRQRTISAGQAADTHMLGLLLRQPGGMLPVLDHGVLVGIITIESIAAHLIEDDDATAGRLWWPNPPDVM